ncbi:MAG: hypothetical protein ACRD72_19880, partial [Candidatus Angelobacter sp.]
DMGLPMGTPISSLTDGTIAGHGYYGGGGVVSVLSQVNGQPSTVYYQHLDLIAAGIVDRATIRVGDAIGWSGGQLSGGHHPSTSQYSSGPHIEVGRDAPYGGIWGRPMQANVDPLPWLQALAATNGGASLPKLFQGSAAGGNSSGDGTTDTSAPGADDLSEICHRLDNAGHLVDPFSSTASNPVDWVRDTGQALFADAGAIIFRLVFMAFGLILMARVFMRIVPVQEMAQQAAETAVFA